MRAFSSQILPVSIFKSQAAKYDDDDNALSGARRQAMRAQTTTAGNTARFGLWSA
jgi:hypothetical protein